MQLRQARAVPVSRTIAVRPSSPLEVRTDRSRPQVRAVVRGGDFDDSDAEGYYSDENFHSADEGHNDHHPSHGTSGQRDLAALHFMHLLARLRVLTNPHDEDDFIHNIVSVFEEHITDHNDIRALLQKLPARIVADHDNDFHACLYHYLLSDDEGTPSSRGHTARPHVSV